MPTLPSPRTGVAALLLLAATGAAQAQLFRAYLSSSGNDANPCTLQLPCRLLPAGLGAVADGGEVWMLDSANYNTGPVNIGKSVSILAVPGVVGSFIAQDNAPALSITGDGLTVALRNVAIGRNSAAPIPGTHGVLMTGASKLTIENSVINRSPGNSVRVEGFGTLRLVDTTIRFGSGYAVALLNGAQGTIAGANIVNNNGGVGVVSNISGRTTQVSISDSFISGVDRWGVAAATETAGATAKAFVTRTTITRSAPDGGGIGSFSGLGGTASLVIGDSAVMSHTNAWRIEGSGSTIFTLGNNQIREYLNGDGTLTSFAPQ